MLTVLRRWLRPPRPTFDPSWESILRCEFAQWDLFETDELARLRLLVARFVSETDWEAARGMDLTDEVRVVIAAQASVLLLGLEIDEYFDVSSVIVHRSTVKLSGAHRSTAGTMSDAPQHLAGQATPGGPVVLAWSAVRQGARFPRQGNNVVYHEFAHRLDMLSGITDGTPPLGSDKAAVRWAEVCTPAYERVVAGESALRPYAATNPAEFFAVATEAFFTRPDVLVQHERELYVALRAFYRQDTIRRLNAELST